MLSPGLLRTPGHIDGGAQKSLAATVRHPSFRLRWRADDRRDPARHVSAGRRASAPTDIVYDDCSENLAFNSWAVVPPASRSSVAPLAMAAEMFWTDSALSSSDATF